MYIFITSLMNAVLTEMLPMEGNVGRQKRKLDDTSSRTPLARHSMQYPAQYGH